MGWGMSQADPGRWTLAATGSGGDGEGGGPWWRRGAAATGREADLGGEGERGRRGGRRTLAATGSGGDGERRRRGAAATGRAEEAEGWRSHCRPKQYIVSSLARVRWHECACAHGTWRGE